MTSFRPFGNNRGGSATNEGPTRGKYQRTEINPPDLLARQDLQAPVGVCSHAEACGQ